MPNRRRSFYTLFLTLVLVLIVPIGIMQISANTTTRTLVRQDYIALNSQIIENIRAAIDTYITARVNLTYGLAANQSLKILAARFDTTSEETLTACRELYNFTRAMQAVDSIFHAAAIYLPNRDLVVSSTSLRIDAGIFYENAINFNNQDADAFYQYVHSVQVSQYAPSMRSEPTSGSARNLVLYVQPIDLGYLSCRAFFISLIDADAFARLITGSFDGNVHFRILDSQGTELIHSADIPWTWNQTGQTTADQWAEADHGIVYQVFSSRSESGLKYVFYVPEATVLKQLSLYQRIGWIILAICLIISVGLAGQLSMQLHKPLVKLLKLAFPGGVLKSVHSIQEEYGLVADQMLEAHKLNQQFQQEIQTYYEATRTHRLLRLLIQSSLMTDDELQEIAEMSGLPLQDAVYQVAVISLARMQGQAMGQVASLFDEQPGIILLMVQLAPDQVALILAIPQNQPELIAQAPKMLMDRFRDDKAARIGISRVHDQPRQLQYCLSEASAAGSPDQSLPDASCLSYAELIANTETIYYPLEKEFQIINAVRSGSFAETRQLLDEIHQYNRSQRRLAPDMLLCLYNSLIATALKAYDCIKSEQPDVLEHSLSMLSMLNSDKKSGVQSFENIVLLYQQLCGLSLQSMQHKNQRIISKVLDYLNEAYTDPALCLDMVAEHFKVSYYFLSHIFKDETRQSFSDILNGIRIDRVIGLLRTTNTPVQEIANQVGYTNWSTFLRAFRKRTGTTPMQYRKDL